MSAFTFSPRAVALARYGSRAIVPYIRQSPRWARRQGRLVRKAIKRSPVAATLGAYEVGRLTPNYTRSARLSQMLRNKRKKMYLKNRIGERVGTSNAKHHENDQVYDGLAALDTKNLYEWRLLDIPQQLTTQLDSNAIDRRQRNVINFRGIKFCMYFKRRSIDTGFDAAWLYVNMAIISPKSSLAANESIPVTNFFRNDGSDRSKDFDAGTNSALDYRCLPINTDKYNVHRHRRFSLAPMTSTEGRDQKIVEFYYPLKRQIRYNGSNVYPEGKNMYMLIWFTLSNQLTSTAAQKVCEFHLKRVQYFRETGSV